MTNPTYEIDGRDFVEPVFVANGLGGSRSAVLPADIPLPALLRRITLTNNGPFPPGTAGNWGLYFDRGGVYTAASGYPATQTGSFEGLDPLVEINIVAGTAPEAEVKFSEDSPLVYRAGDRILVDVGCQGGGSVEPLWSIEFEVPFGTLPAPVVPPIVPPVIPPVIPPSGNSTVVFGPTSIGGDNGASTNLSVRNVTTPITATYSQVRATFKGGSVAGLQCAHASIGILSASGDTIGTPVELTFGGISGFAGAPGGLNTSDFVPIAIEAGQSLVIIIDGSAVSGDLSFEAGSATMNYFKANTASYNVATPAGFTPTSTMYGLYSVEAK